MRISIESELTWRKEEIIFFKNQLANIKGEEEQNKYRKSLVLIGSLPNDTRLHRLYRRVDLVEKMEDFKTKKLHIEDEVIDTESNLWYIVLQKNLYKVGLPIDVFESHKRTIDRLVNRRNGIAHGNERSGVSYGEYEKMEEEVVQVMEDINRLLYDYAEHEKYLSAKE